jgi:adenosylcobinamide-phosphate synthase
MIYHSIAFFLGFLLDLLVGDPYFMPHPIRLIGHWIGGLEKKLNQGENRRRKGTCMVLLVLLLTLVCFGGILALSYLISPYAGLVVESWMTYQILATKCLRTESMKVYDRLEQGSLEEARQAVSMIVGRDTNNLSDEGVTKAAVETVAENTSDGVIAPMLYLAIGGPVPGFLYKAINTMDSMVGYKNEKYLEFGHCAAKLDDVVNFLPSRISALLMILVSRLLGREFDGKAACRIWKRDRRKHASPNSAQTEAVCAGALSIQLAGPTSYFGSLVEKPYIGDNRRKPEHADIVRANRLLYGTAWLCEAICLFIMAGLIFMHG